MEVGFEFLVVDAEEVVAVARCAGVDEAAEGVGVFELGVQCFEAGLEAGVVTQSVSQLSSAWRPTRLRTCRRV